MTPDGRFVVFRSDASNLVAADTNGMTDVFVRHRDSNRVERVSVASDGTQANGTSHAEPSSLISRDGRYVVFTSDATNLVPGDTNGQTDVFLRDWETGTTRRVNVGPGGLQADRYSGHARISSDGRFIAFWSYATNLVPNVPPDVVHVYVHDRLTGVTSIVSKSTNGVPGDHDSFRSDISADGRFVVFETLARNLAAGDTNGSYDIYVHDRLTGATARASLSTTGAQVRAVVPSPQISGNGRLVTFSTDPGHRALSSTTPTASTTSDARSRHRPRRPLRRTGRRGTFRISKSATGEQGNAISLGSAISFDGRFVTITSDADNLLGPGQDENRSRDIFITTSTPTATASSTSPATSASPAPRWPAMARHGSRQQPRLQPRHQRRRALRPLRLQRRAIIVRGDTNQVMDCFVVDRLAWKTTPSMAPPTSLQQPRDQRQRRRGRSLPRRTRRSSRATPTARWTCSCATGACLLGAPEPWCASASPPTAHRRSVARAIRRQSAATAASSRFDPPR